MLPAEEVIADFLPSPPATQHSPHCHFSCFIVCVFVCLFHCQKKKKKPKQKRKYSCLSWEITQLKSFWVLSCSKNLQTVNQSFVCSWKSQLISAVIPICIYADFNQILNWAGYYRKVSRGLNYFWTVALNLLGQSLFRPCRYNFFLSYHHKASAAALTITCACVSDLYVYAVFVCSIGIISVLLFTLVILCQSLLSKRRSTGEPNAIPDHCKALAKKGDARRGEGNAEKAGKNKYCFGCVFK